MRKNNIGKVLKLGFLYLSTIIGAGFATGREIRVYFTDYGVSGFIGLGISTILLIGAGCAITLIVYKTKTETVSEFNEIIGGKYLGKALTIVISSFSYCLYVIILAGLADLCKQNFGIDKIYTVLMVTVISLLVHTCGFKALTYVCSLSAPVITICVLIVAFLTLKTDFSLEETRFIPMSTFSAVLYVGYNILVAISIMSRAVSLIDSKKTAIGGVVIGTLSIMICALIVNISLFMSYERIKYSDMPLLTLVELYMGNWGYGLFLGMLLGTMLTSAISGLSSVLHIAGNKGGMVFVVLSIPLSFIGFGPLMDILYPLYGAFGILVLLMLVLSVRIIYNKARDDQFDKQANRYKLRKTKKEKFKKKIHIHSSPTPGSNYSASYLRDRSV